MNAQANETGKGGHRNAAHLTDFSYNLLYVPFQTDFGLRLIFLTVYVLQAACGKFPPHRSFITTCAIVNFKYLILGAHTDVSITYLIVAHF